MVQKTVFIVTFGILIGSSAAAQTVNLDVDDVTRSYVLVQPDELHDPITVVIAFHGGGGSASQFMPQSGLVELAEKEGFVVAFLTSTRLE
jgi:poly(3-hydroxybutyrate) depolymerase